MTPSLPHSPHEQLDWWLGAGRQRLSVAEKVWATVTVPHQQQRELHLRTTCEQGRGRGSSSQGTRMSAAANARAPQRPSSTHSSPAALRSWEVWTGPCGTHLRGDWRRRLAPQLLDGCRHAIHYQGAQGVTVEQRHIRRHVVAGLCGAGVAQQGAVSGLVRARSKRICTTQHRALRLCCQGHVCVCACVREAGSHTASRRLKSPAPTLLSASIMRLADVARRWMCELSLNTRRCCSTVRAVV